MKTVEYRGYAIRVPATWPVYLLSEDPSQCVRYDVNAVYLGSPGPNQKCPPHLVGRADTVSIGGPATPGARSAPVRTKLRAAIGAKRAGRGMPGMSRAAAGTIMPNAPLREFAVAMPDQAPAITATYGSDADLIMRMLAGLHQIKPQSAQAGSAPGPWPAGTVPGWPWPAVMAASAVPQASQPPTNPPSSSPPPTSPAPSSTQPTWVPPSWPTPTPTATGTPTQPANPAPSPPPPPPAGTLTGFDTCTAPSLQAMKAWRAKYASAAIYIGEQEMGCDYGNLSKS